MHGLSLDFKSACQKLIYKEITLYTLKRFVDVEKAHIFAEEGGNKFYPCKFDESKHVMEKSSMRLDINKIRIAVAKSANADSEICGICVGALYAK